MSNLLFNPQVDAFFAQGCGRCSLFDTPKCKVHLWQEEMQTLRNILLEAGLTEERKWGNPCYTWKGKNVAMLGAWKESCSISFFKGSLLQDKKKLLVAAGENSQAARLFRFTTLKDIEKIQKDIAVYILEAIALEEAGKKVVFKPATEFAIPEELIEKFEDSPELKSAFYALTP
ncbi:MAG: DUF1801 domain-containing protein, partial [Flavobacteriales bacterium]